MGFSATLLFESTTLVPVSLFASECLRGKKPKVWYNMQYMSYNHLTASSGQSYLHNTGKGLGFLTANS